MWRLGRRNLVKTSILVCLFAVGSACALKRDASAPSHPPAGPDGEWKEAQRDLESLSPEVDGDPNRVTMLHFRIETEREPFYCGDTGLHAVLLVYGCFRAEPEEHNLGVIRYVPGRGALRHEARHAILFALGDSRWADVGH